MHLFRTIAFASILAGIIAGSAITMVQYVGTTPLILKAETYEDVANRPTAVHAHDPSPGQETSIHEHGNDEESWQPADGLERTAFSLVANILTAVGYAFVLCGLMSATAGELNWKRGLLWGLAGFACVMLAPMMALPPELPGSPAGPLEARQVWWVGTALATAFGIGLATYVRKPWAIALGVATIVAPHFVPAPMPSGVELPLAPEELEHQFILAAAITSLIFWALLGASSGAFLKRGLKR